MNKSMLAKILVIVVVTAVLGEFRVNPFDSSFRFGLGSAVFFFLLLFYKDIPYALTGLVTGICTTFFRISLDLLLLDAASFFESFQIHSPIIAFYVTFALLLQFIKRKRLYQNPIWIGLWGAFCDGFSNFVELMITHSFSPITIFSSVEITYVLTVAVVRSFFVVGLFTMFQASKLNAVYQEQRSRFEQVQTILSELYIEGFYLRKTLNEIEEVTAKGHSLYRKLKGTASEGELSTQALMLVQELHEVKKDNQRILAGLEKVIHNEDRIMPLTLSEIIDLSIKSNQKYAQYLKKNIDFAINQQVDSKIVTVYPLLVIINNLVANAIEAISVNGYVKINSKGFQGHLVIEVIDNGIGIHKDEHDVIFEPGYTSKFSESGKASTGIGLSHVKSMVAELGGTISVSSDCEGTSFTIHLPISVFQAKG